MRQLRHVILNLGLALAVVAPGIVIGVVPSVAVADARSDARTHYQAGVKAYNAGDYKVAIREFSAAQSLAPADLNNYNLALCYDKLGDAEPAIQYYKSYLDKVPNTDKRAEIEASVQRLDAALKSSNLKKEEARKAEEAKKAADLKKAEEDKKKADEDAKRKADEEAKVTKDPDPADGTKIGPVAPPRPGVGRPGVGTTGTPSTGDVRPTGDNQIDRVNQINIDQVRDQRVGGNSSGIPDRKRPPANVNPTNPRVGVSGGTGGGDPDPAPAANDPRAGAGTQAPAADPATAPTDKPKAVVPVYKKWWFWAVVAVSAYVVYSIASEDSKQSGQGRTLLPTPGTGQPGGGMTLWRF